MSNNVYGGQFCNHDEHQITTLGTGYIANFISAGSLERAGATLTNRRIYFSGNTFSLRSNGTLMSIKEQKIVNLRDVTGVGYKLFSPIHYAIAAIAALLLGIMGMTLTMQEVRSGWQVTTQVSIIGGISITTGIIAFIVLLVTFYVSRKTLLTIEYAGGNISFDARWLQSNEQDIFIRNIHLAKDKLYSMVAVEQGFVSDDNVANEIPDL